jgi:hypothetical protein
VLIGEGVTYVGVVIGDVGVVIGGVEASAS